MRWEDGRRSDNIDDRRDDGIGSNKKLPSIGSLMIIWPLIKPLLRTKFGWALIAVGVGAYMMGINPLILLSGGSSTTTTTVKDKAKDEQNAQFISTVLASTEDIWKKRLRGYQEPIVVLYRGTTNSGCGTAKSQTGPFYCPADQKVYLDLSFFDELSQIHNPPGDFAQAYILAHEIGHHIQNLQGILNKVHKAKQKWGEDSKKANALQVKVELQADCYAGAWAYQAHKNFYILEAGDVEEALQAASAIGDDTLQRESGEMVRPDAFTHGSSAQRVAWFKKGFNSGNISDCDIFK
ncbi:MAG: neutral zinc metallopeptidase [Sulfurovum sp.]